MNVSGLHHDDAFLQAYHELRRSVDFSGKGFAPDLNQLIFFLILGMPEVPADARKDDPEAQLTAIYQRIAILKAVFVEVNHDQSDDFLDNGLALYDQAADVTLRMWERSHCETTADSEHQY